MALDPGKPIVFKPGGRHVMLTGLNGPLKPGETFPLNLTFELVKLVTVVVMVEATGAQGIGHEHGTMPGMEGKQNHMTHSP